MKGAKKQPLRSQDRAVLEYKISPNHSGGLCELNAGDLLKCGCSEQHFLRQNVSLQDALKHGEHQSNSLELFALQLISFAKVTALQQSSQRPHHGEQSQGAERD